jgi:sulfite reductase alpha subunit-like flavoprotein
LITILVGTVTGTAEIVADEVATVLAEQGCGAAVRLMDGLTAEVFSGGGVYLICSSTYGKGNVPDNAAALYASLGAARPDLSEVAYGVISLGDRRYPKTFANGGKRFDEILRDLGARRIGTLMEHDASSGILPEELAVEWARDWIGTVIAERVLSPCRS